MDNQFTSQKKASELIIKHLQGDLTTVERGELDQWLNASEAHRELFEELTKEEQLRADVREIPKLKNRILNLIYAEIPEARETIPLYKRPMLRWVAAASIVLMLGLGSYLLFFNKQVKQDEVVNTAKPNDVKAPETNRAMITLADGRQLYLDSIANGELVQQGNVKLVKLANGQIAYQTASGEILKEIKYNTLQNPRGSKAIDMTLADGSRVWLNAGSSVTYPITFVGTERKVSITGEAYFEISHDAGKPFIVSKGAMQVQVLGTRFNVNAYDDETNIKVTLLEGLVKVNTRSESSLLKPGQQALVGPDIKVANNVDTEQVMAWKNGRFQFESTDIKEVMRQIARWYDVEVEYQDTIEEKLGGTISRNVTASQVFKMLELTGIVHFRIEGRKVVVTK